MSGLAGLSGVRVEDPLVLAAALNEFVAGMDFANALHLAEPEECTVLLTFDLKLVKAAKGRSSVPVVAS